MRFATSRFRPCKQGYIRHLVHASMVAICAMLWLPCLGVAQTLKLTLRECIRTAQTQGPLAIVARKALESNRATYAAFRARLLPQVSLNGDLPNFTRAIEPVIQPDGTTFFVQRGQAQSSLNLNVSQRVPLTGGEFFLSSGLSRLDLLNERVTLWQASPVLLGFRQGLFRPNDIRWDMQEQDLSVETAERRYLEDREDIALQAANAFFDVYIAQLAMANAADNVITNDTLWNLSKGRFTVGKIAENELLQSELALLNARAYYASTTLSHERALARLRIVLNLSASQAIELQMNADIPSFSVDAAFAAEQATLRRSDVPETELQVLQAARRLNEAELSNGFNATLSAVAGWNQTAGLLPDAYRSVLDQQRVSLNFQMPILQWGAGSAAVEAATAEQERANTALARANLEMDALFAARQFAQLQRQVEITAKSDTIATRRFDVAKNRYIIGKSGMADLFIAQNEKNTARRVGVETLRDFWLAYYRVRRLTLYDFEQHQPIVHR
jgi:outer membrane protein TolC